MILHGDLRNNSTNREPYSLQPVYTDIGSLLHSGGGNEHDCPGALHVSEAIC